MPKVLPLPGQLKPYPTKGAKEEKLPPEQAIAKANKAARMEPTRAGYINAIQVYPWTEGALYRLYASPEKVSTIALQPGEELIDVSTGDTVRWVVGDTIERAGKRAAGSYPGQADAAGYPDQPRGPDGPARLSPRARLHQADLYGVDLVDLSDRYASLRFISRTTLLRKTRSGSPIAACGSTA